MEDSLLRIEREESVLILLILVVLLWVLSCFRSARGKMKKNENLKVNDDLTQTLSIRKFRGNFNTSYQTQKHLSE